MTYRPIPTTAAIRVDLYSDTMTRPSTQMRAAMAAAEVGDEQKGEDPTVNELQDLVCELLGKPAAVFLPSGTMCNQIALCLLCRPGDEVFCDFTAHPLTSEAGGGPAHAGVQLTALQGTRGVYTPSELEAAVRTASRYTPRGVLAWVEQTSNFGGGRCWQPSDLAAVVEVSRRHHLGLHLDGARLFNAVVASGVSAAQWAEPFDTAWIDLSKGLGAPVGAVLAGSEELIDQAWRLKQRMGGSMRQAGIVAAGGLYALRHHVDRLSEDHDLARRLAEGLADLPDLVIDPTTVETNIVIFALEAGPGAVDSFVDRLLIDHGVRVSVVGPNAIRLVTHLDVSDADGDIALQAIKEVLAA